METFSNRFGKYEAIAERAARIFGLLGRWWVEEDFDLASSAIKEFSTPKTRSGLFAFIELERYPGVLLMYSYGFGLLKAARYADLFQLFCIPVPQHDVKKPLITRCFLGSWDEVGKHAFDGASGRGGEKASLSDHLFDLFRVWLQDYVFIDSDIPLLYAEFEILASLAYLTFSVNLSDFIEADKRDPAQGNYVWCPVGRVAWDVSNREQIIEKLKTPANAKTLLEAGFAKGDQRFFDLALGNIHRFCKAMQSQWRGWRDLA